MRLRSAKTNTNADAAVPGEQAMPMPYFLRSRAPLGNASNLSGVLKRPKPSRSNSIRGVSKVTKRPKQPAQSKGDVTTRVSVERAAGLKVPEQLTQSDHQEGAQQAFSSATLSILDVDAPNAGDPQLCSEYVKDIYAYLQHLEVAMAIRPCYLEGREVTGAMRMVVVDWLIQVQRQFKLLQETLFMTVWIIDRFLQDNPVPKESLQLVSVTAMLIASKYEERYPPTVEEFAYVTDHSYSCLEICNMEKHVLKALNFCLGRPVPPHFLRRASMVWKVGPKEHGLAKYLMELTLLDYSLVHMPPSLIATAAFALSLKVLHFGEWNPILQHYTGYPMESLRPVMQRIVHMIEHINKGRTKYQSVKLKYACVELLGVSHLPELSNVFLEQLF